MKLFLVARELINVFQKCATAEDTNSNGEVASLP